MGDEKVEELVKHAMLIALTTVATMLIRIPSPATKGYVNLGDAMVLLAALLLGKKSGFIVGGIGSALADLILGYTYYIPITFIVKGLEGLLVGYLWEKEIFKNKLTLVTAIGGLWMAFGYYLFQIPLYGGKAALASMPGNIAQGLIGAAAAIALYKPLKNTKYF